jgi:hypothetical protein
MNRWQPIDTAPKDGSLIFGWIPGSCYATEIVFMRWDSDGPSDCIGWWWEAGDHGGMLDIDPTHWQPLPEPPVSA